MPRLRSSGLLLSLVLLLATFAASNAFLAPRPSVVHGRSAGVHLYQSSSDDDGGTSINIALVTATASSNFNDELQTALADHPFCKMTGIKLVLTDIPSSTVSDLSKDIISVLQNADIAAFDTMSAVKTYLTNLNNHLDTPDDMSDEDKRKLPNKPDTVDGEFASIMAACPTFIAARECLNSGRWMNNHIYYPKDTQKAVELKTESLEGSDGDVADEEEEGEIDVNIWADAIAQAAGDVMERSSWGGGW